MAKKEAKEENLIFGWSDNVFYDFNDYHSDKLKELHDTVRNRKYTVGDTSSNYRNLNHWQEIGILPDGVSNDGKSWKKFNLIELVWLRAVKKMREFGLSLDAIKQVKENVLEWNPDHDSYMWFEYHVLRAKVSGLDAYIATLPNGSSGVTFSRIIERDKVVFGSRSFILISLKEILDSMGMKAHKPETLFSLSQEELDIIYSIREEDIDSIRVRMKNGKVKNIDTSKTISGSDVSSIKDEIKTSGDFADVITKFEGGKEQSATVIKKKKY